MPVVEKLLRDDERHEVTVYCAGERFRITTVDCDLLALEQGCDVTEELLEELHSAAARLACIQKAFVYLSYGDLSKRRLSEKLSRTFPKELSVEVVKLLEERGYLDDLRLAQRYAENYYEVRSYGPIRIKQELYGKGFSLPDIEHVLEPYRSMDHSEKIQELLSSKYSEEELFDSEKRKKAVAWLNRCGYDWNSISSVLQEIF